MKMNNVTIKKRKQGNYNYVVYYPLDGERKRKLFEKRVEAEEWALQKRQELAEIGSKEAPISQEERYAVYKWRKMVAILPEHAQKVTLSNCVEQFAKKHQDRNKAITCQEVADKLDAKLSVEGCGKSWIKTLEYRRKQFLTQYGEWLTCDVSTEIIDEFLTDCLSGYAPQTVKHYKQALNQMFNHAVKLKASPNNPVAEAIDVKVLPSEAGILTVEQTTALLSNADEDTLAGLAISFFAGLRRSEIEKIDWKDIKLSNGYITVSARNAKSSQRRNVTICDNLMAWLKPHAKPNGKVTKSHAIWRSGVEKAREKAGITDWAHNAGRHSFASYHANNPVNEEGGFKTAKQLGHSNPSLLWRHYHTLVTPEDCVDYWNIYPPKAEDEKITRISA